MSSNVNKEHKDSKRPSVCKDPGTSANAASSTSVIQRSKGFVVLMGTDSSDPDEVVRLMVQLRREKGWSSRLFSLHSLRGSEGLYEEWCEKMTSEVCRLGIASSVLPAAQERESSNVLAEVVLDQFEDAIDG